MANQRLDKYTLLPLITYNGVHTTYHSEHLDSILTTGMVTMIVLIQYVGLLVMRDYVEQHIIMQNLH